MEFRNCPRCGKIFVFVKQNICNDCIIEEEKIFEKVKKYIKENENATIVEVAKNTEVSERKILKYLKEGRLEIVQNIDTNYKCKNCGKKILTGNFCNDCLLEIFQENKENLEKNNDIKNKNGIKMHTYEMIKTKRNKSK